MFARATRRKWAACLLACALLLGGCASPQLGYDSQKDADSIKAATANIDLQQPSDLEENSSAGTAEGDETTTAIDKVKATLNDKEFTIELADNETASAFAKLLPLDTEMPELNGNEKYVYLDGSLPSDPTYPGTIEVGDVMLYGNNCLVVFYGSHPTTYSYTRIGKITDPSGLAEALGGGPITAVFSAE